MDKASSAELRRFGERVRALRLRLDLSQAVLAERAGLHVTYIAGLERGDRNISLSRIHALASGLGVDIAELFGEAP